MTADEHIPKDSTNRIFSLKNATSNVLINWLQVYNIHLSNLNKAFNIFLNLLIYIKSNSKTFNNSSNLRFQVPCTGSFKLCFIRLEIYIIHYNIHSWESDFWMMHAFWLSLPSFSCSSNSPVFFWCHDIHTLCFHLPVSYHPTDVQPLQKDTKKLYIHFKKVWILNTGNRYY